MAGVPKNVKQEDRTGKERLQLPEEHHTYMPKRNRYLLHGQNSTKKMAAVLRTKQREEDKCCVTDKNNTKKRKKCTAIYLS